jgi:hypothetical protein
MTKIFFHDEQKLLSNNFYCPILQQKLFSHQVCCLNFLSNNPKHFKQRLKFFSHSINGGNQAPSIRQLKFLKTFQAMIERNCGQ